MKTEDAGSTPAHFAKPYDPSDPFDIPTALRRTDDRKRLRITAAALNKKREWIMPTPERLARLKKERDRVKAATKRALAKDLSLGHAVDPIVDEVTEIQKKVK